MIHENGNRILDNLERRFGGLALPQILRWIAGFQVMTWALSLFSPEFLEWIVFDRGAILSGQVWRLFTWVLYPAVTGGGISIIFLLFALIIMFLINDSLEREWTPFRLNVYVFATVFALSLVGMIPFAAGAGSLLNMVFYSSMFLAFATLFPDFVLHLMGIIPVKAKWLGWVNAALLVAAILTSMAPIIVGLIILFGLIPYFLVFVPAFVRDYKLRGESAVRKHRFEQEMGNPDEAFHACDSCGATDKTHPEREFRVTADDRELCDACRNTPEA